MRLVFETTQSFYIGCNGSYQVRSVQLNHFFSFFASCVFYSNRNRCSFIRTKTVFINFSDLVFKSCFLDVDSSTSEEFVIAEFFDAHVEEVVTFHIKMEHETWMEYMEMYFRYINIQ